MDPQKSKGPSKGVLNPWSSLAGAPVTPVATPGKPRTVNTSDTFAAFQKAAKEKADRERNLREQQEHSRKVKERSDRERQRMEIEKRKEREEEDALEQVFDLFLKDPKTAPEINSISVSQARRNMVLGSNLAQTTPQTVPPPAPTPPLAAPPAVPLRVAPPAGSPGTGAAVEPARAERDRQRQREQDRRRREAQQNQIDMNRQSDLMAAFEENII